MVEKSEMEAKIKVVQALKKQGIPVVKEEVRSSPTSNTRADLIGYTIDENDELSSQVVVEIKDDITKEAQKQLMNLTEAIAAPYALLATPDKQIWFKTDTFLSTEPPTFNSYQKYLSSEKLKKDTLWKLMDQLRGEFQPEKVWLYIIQGLLVRSYMEEKSILNKWDELNEGSYLDLINEAYKFYQIDLDLEKAPVTESLFERFKWALSEMAPKDSSYANFMIDLSEKISKDIEHRTVSSVKDLFVGLVNTLNHSSYSVVEMCAGYGSITHGLMQQKAKIASYFGMELNWDVAEYHKILMIISGYPDIQVQQGDVLDRNNQLPNQQDLVIIDPPLGLRVPQGRYDGYELLKNKNSQALDLMLERASEILKSGGHVICFVNESFLYQGTSQQSRELLADRMIIESIISLPTHTLKPLTSIKTSVLVLRKKEKGETEPKELFVADCETIDEFPEAVKGFEKWKKGETL
ncbi:Type I restriction-modification system, DNA methylase subunit [Pelagirhabdus alkalitolerans]|uniref:site-specific DNA-methyltransferase (adenine-specific) n=1 Tax=Pelagirhabdus alkalitolerans TaxID=1612202 RepID=A0A1G6N0R4_9BACI|nr:N-6 DNA methylase [Pelagirhabdus alkalitolerans]SDC61054.1 Type I restriction-modification system, DNA methylase subunit [Pelagirhabdus alkalitolerans]